MIADADYHNVRRWLADCRRPLLVTHRRPDGDALGALVGMTLGLRKLGADPLPTLFEPFPARYTLLADAVPWRRWDQERESLTGACDALVILDTCAVSQLDPIAEFLPQAPRTLVIDHHPTPDPLATRAGDLRLLDETAGAACLLIAEWLTAAGLSFDRQTASALFTGLATDTGWFRFSNADARLLRVAADLMDAGAPAHTIHRLLYQQDPPAKLRLIARMLQSLELHADDRLAVMCLRKADFAAAGADRTLTEDLVNEAGRLGCTEATLLFLEENDAGVRVNFRSKQTLDVAALAKHFGGGGHKRAAGARPTGTWDELVPQIIAATVAALEPDAR